MCPPSQDARPTCSYSRPTCSYSETSPGSISITDSPLRSAATFAMSRLTTASPSARGASSATLTRIAAVCVASALARWPGRASAWGC